MLLLVWYCYYHKMFCVSVVPVGLINMQTFYEGMNWNVTLYKSYLEASKTVWKKDRKTSKQNIGLFV
jgi:hypothetical protein